MWEIFSSPENWASLLTLTVLEIVLGVDNLIFLSILASRLPIEKRRVGRRLGLGAALITRLGLLASVAWIVTLSQPVFTVLDLAISWRDIILGVGGLFLIAKSTLEVHHSVEGGDEFGPKESAKVPGLWSVVAQIAVIDIIFSLDTVMTAVGMSDHFPIMAFAVIAAVCVMLFAAEPLSRFVDAHPTVKMLALSFLILIGVSLIADALHFHIPKAYLYFAVAFSIGVESLNLWATKRLNAKRAAAKRTVE
ncbi:TerC family protein [Parvibaculum sedimenti]|uniref:TerC family protein n=1 Tax=Parvibaculum sedimenti TaxID=2608632 RepID=A0A6N6VJA9_9HYPH|nr:TerC family protein [Parvibaculum sedimenti]KAB7739346.1 TerC family protein [Parvibaculum sedimenti]